MRTKACSKCGVVQPLSAFSLRSDSPDGHRADCKECVRAQDRERYQSNPEPAKQRAKTWYLANPERAADSRRQWALANQDKRSEVMKRWVLEHPDRHEEHRKKWRSANQEKVLCYQQLQYAVQKGELLKSATCQKCGATDVRIEGHHQAYSKPLEVMWLCSPCHKDLHVQQRRNEQQLERKSA